MRAAHRQPAGHAEPRCPESWWADAPPQGFTARCEQEQPRMRSKGITYFAELTDVMAMRKQAMGRPKA